MRSLFLGIALAALLLAASAANADSWDYVYGGVVDPVSAGWSRYGAAEQPVWNADTGDGHKALVISHDAVNKPGNQPYYQYNPVTGHACMILQMRFRIEGGAPMPANECYYERFRYNDDRSRLWRTTIGATGDDFWDPDFISDNYIAPFDNNWHTFTLIMVGGDGADPLNPINNYGAANPGAVSYLDGVQVASRPANLTSNAADFQIGIVRNPPAAYGAASLWIDYVAWGFDDTKDELGNYGWDINNLPGLNPDYPVPEPSSILALCAGLAGVACTLRRRIGR